MLNGRRCRESLGISATKANIEAAGRLRAQIVAEIRAGVFDYGRHFPDRANPQDDTILFSQVAQAWLKSLDELAYSTVQGYRKIANRHLLPAWGHRDIRQIRYGEIREWLAAGEWRTPKTRNNVLSVLKRVFSFALADRLIEADPTDGVAFQKRQRPQPDPLSIDEIDALLAKAASAWRPYFEFACFSGLRVSELVGLTWGDVDLHAGYVRVQQAKVRGRRKGTKTYTARDVMLNARSRAALQAQKAATYMASGPVFTNPATGAEINDDKPPRLAWDAAIKAAGLRHRPAKNTRHTYASILLMSGEPLAWCAQQMGHSVQMMLTVYARWIDRQAVGAGDRVGQFLGQQPGTQGVIGR